MTRHQPPHEAVTKSPAQHELGMGDIVEIGLGNSEASELPIIMNQQTIAQIQMGGSKSGNEEQKAENLYLLKITNPDSQDYQDLLRQARVAGDVRQDDYVLASTYDGPNGHTGVGSIALLQNTDGRGSIVGRARNPNIRWFGFGPSATEELEGTPFWYNLGVSRHQFRITTSDGGATIVGLSRNSRTTIKAPDMNVRYVQDRNRLGETGADGARGTAERRPRKSKAGSALAARIMRRR